MVELVGVAVSLVGGVRASHLVRREPSADEDAREDDGRRRGRPREGAFERRPVCRHCRDGREERHDGHQVGDRHAARQAPERDDADDAEGERGRVAAKERDPLGRRPLADGSPDDERRPRERDHDGPDKSHAPEELAPRAVSVAVVVDEEPLDVLVDEEVGEEAGVLLRHQREPRRGEGEEEDETPAPAVTDEFAAAAVDEAVDDGRPREEDERDRAFRERAEREGRERAERPGAASRLQEEDVAEVGAGDAGGQDGVRHRAARKRVERDARRGDADGEEGPFASGERGDGGEEEGQRHERREDRGQADGELAPSEGAAGERAQLELEGRLAVKALVASVVGEARHEVVARPRHVGGNGRVAGLGRVEDGHRRGEEDAHGEEGGKDADGSSLFHAA